MEAEVKKSASDWLLITGEPALLHQTKAALGANAELQFRRDTVSGIELASSRHLDGFIIDCDDLPGGTEALVAIRNSRANRQSVIIAVTNQVTTEEAALELGASFVLAKPVQEAVLRDCLLRALPQAEKDHRRHFRHKIRLDIELQDHDSRRYYARILNVSEEGLAVGLSKPVSMSGILSLEFELPLAKPHRFRGKATVTWTAASAMGLRFLYIEPSTQPIFQEWLDSLS